jgi:predicted CopG family antitoxin
MKTIKITDEMYEFLINLSHELNTQNNRFTATPYIFQIQDEEEFSVGEGVGEVAWFYDGTIIRTEDEIKEVIFEYIGWDINNESDEESYAKMDWYDKEEILHENFQKIYMSTRNVYINAFLTEKACVKHIELNKHHYKKPIDYLSHAFRNPELEKVLEFLKTLK